MCQHRVLYIVVISVLVACAAMTALWPLIMDELQLQFHSHLNSSHQAQENFRLVNEVRKMRKEMEGTREKMKRCQQCEIDVDLHAKENARLVNEVDKLRTEIEEMRERMKQCLNDVDTEHSVANRSYWYGVNVTMLYSIGLIVATIFSFCCLYFCYLYFCYLYFCYRGMDGGPRGSGRYQPRFALRNS